MRFWGIVAIAVSLLLTVGCGKQNADKTFFALDTVIELRQIQGGTEEDLVNAQHMVTELENLLSCHKQGSDIWRINQSEYGQPVQVAEKVYDLLERAQEISLKTEGRFDVTIKPLSDLWNVKHATAPPSEVDIQRAMDQVGFPNLELLGQGVVQRLSPDTQLDLGGMAKGMIADEMRAFLIDCGVQRGILDLGGSITLIGSKEQNTPWTVGIKNPFETSKSYAKLFVADTSVVTSAGYERYFTYQGKQYHHIFDPYTGYPAESGLQSVTVVAGDTALADALSTAIFVGGKDRGFQWAKEFGVEVVMVDKEKHIWITEGLRDKIEVMDESFHLMEG